LRFHPINGLQLGLDCAYPNPRYSRWRSCCGHCWSAIGIDSNGLVQDSIINKSYYTVCRVIVRAGIGGKKLAGPYRRRADALWWIDSQKAKRQRLAADLDAQNTGRANPYLACGGEPLGLALPWWSSSPLTMRSAAACPFSASRCSKTSSSARP
jgi:hypothetical protein